MDRDESLAVVRALAEHETGRTVGGHVVAWGAIVLAAGAAAVMLWLGNEQLGSVTRAKADSEAKLAAAIEAQESQITVLQNVIQQTTVKLTDKDKAIYELQFIIQELKQAAGIEAEAGRVLLTLADDNSVEFERSQSVLSEAQKIKLAENFVLLRYAQNFPNFGIEISGHTDYTWDGKEDLSQFSKDKNHELSEKRAAAVKDFLVAHGMPPAKITAEGRGMLWPRGVTDAAADATIRLKNASELDQRANRRVEVLVKGVDLNAPSVRRTEPTADSATP